MKVSFGHALGRMVNMLIFNTPAPQAKASYVINKNKKE